MAHSSAARAAGEALTREMAEDWAGDGIAVCAVAPGHFDTSSLRKYPEAIRRGAAEAVPLQRLGRTEEHAWLVALLASPLGPVFSESVVTLDGARDNWLGRWPPRGHGRARRLRAPGAAPVTAGHVSVAAGPGGG